LINRTASHEPHRPFSLGAHQTERSLNARLSRRGQWKKIRPAQSYRLCAHRERFQHMGPALNSAVEQNIDLVAYSVDNFGKLVKRAA
jgi:hypothetical protein